MTVLSKGNLFQPELVTDLISKVTGRSSLAKMSAQTPIPFNGTEVMTFNMDSDIDIVAENAPKSHGGISVEPVKIVPIKVEYGARISDEFLYASEEAKVNIIKSFNDGFAKRLARGLDLMAMHGINPRSKTASDVIGTNHLTAKVTETVTFDDTKADENINSAIAMIQGADREFSGMILAPSMASALASLKNTAGESRFPELMWGGNPDSLKGIKSDVNTTVSMGNSLNMAFIGDFESRFKWGYSKQVPFEVIKYGDPDNTGKDLKGHNQVYFRAEAYLGWGILDAQSFARIVKTGA